LKDTGKEVANGSRGLFKGVGRRKYADDESEENDTQGLREQASRVHTRLTELAASFLLLRVGVDAF
jgi:hypothetical protein